MYELFKFIHVLAVVVWLGAGVTFLVLNLRLAAANDHDGIMALTSQGEWFGKVIFSTAAITTLVAGVITVLLGDLSFGSFWISYGFVGVVVSIVLGAGVSQRTTNELADVVASEGPGAPAVAGLQRRLNIVGAIDLLVLTSVVAVMVFKPGA